MQKYLFIFLVCLFSGLPLFSQNNDKDTKNSKEKTSKERTFMGVVKDQSGEPLPGAVVYVKSKPASGTSTDAYGNFILKNIPEGKQIIIISCLGMEPKEFTFTGQKSAIIVLEEKVKKYRMSWLPVSMFVKKTVLPVRQQLIQKKI